MRMVWQIAAAIGSQCCAVARGPLPAHICAVGMGYVRTLAICGLADFSTVWAFKKAGGLRANSWVQYVCGPTKTSGVTWPSIPFLL